MPANSISRRSFVASAAAATALAMNKPASAAALPPQIIDCHTHFYDPSREGGVPWPGKDDQVLYRTMLPKHFAEIAGPHGVTGTVVVEASPLVEDNQWLLDLATESRLIVGVVGHLSPGDEAFAGHIARFAKAPLYRGIRVNHGDLKKGLTNQRFLDDLGRLAEHDLQLDLNGGPDLPSDVARLADKFQDLRIVINHCANLKIDGQQPPAEWLAGMKAAAGHENVWCKASALVEGAGQGGGKSPKNAAFYQPVLEALWAAFGENKLIYGSNWPVSERFGSYETVFNIVHTFFQGKGQPAARKYFELNSQAAYKWRPQR